MKIWIEGNQEFLTAAMWLYLIEDIWKMDSLTDEEKVLRILAMCDKTGYTRKWYFNGRERARALASALSVYYSDCKEAMILIKEITDQEYTDMVLSSSGKGDDYRPLGLFYLRENDKVIGIDNLNGCMFVEEFVEFEECVRWLKGEIEVV
jgi:hypothetical protein